MNYETIKEFYKKNTQMVIIVGILIAIVIYHYSVSGSVESFTAGNMQYLTEKLYVMEGVKDKKSGKVQKVPFAGLGFIPMQTKQLLTLHVSPDGIQKSIITPTSITKNTVIGAIEMLNEKSKLGKRKITIKLDGKRLYVNVDNVSTVSIYRLANKQEDERIKNMIKLSNVQQ